MMGPTYMSGILQVRAYRILQVTVGGVLAKFHLKPTQWFILAYICQADEATSTAIAELLKVETPLITMLTDDLTKQGLIKKTNHPTDGRVKLLKITPKGKILVPKAERALEEALGQLLKGLKPGDLERYKKVLEAIIKNSDPRT